MIFFLLLLLHTTTLAKRDIWPVGDYADRPEPDRALRYGPHKRGFTILTCAKACSEYKYFALQAGTWCSCDNDYHQVTKYGKPDCGPGSDFGIGGNLCNSVYINSGNFTSMPDKKNLVGSYRDVEKLRALRYGPHDYGFNHETCSKACEGYKYFALQSKSWCSCDNDLWSIKKYGRPSCGKFGGAWCNFVYAHNMKKDHPKNRELLSGETNLEGSEGYHITRPKDSAKKAAANQEYAAPQQVEGVEEMGGPSLRSLLTNFRLSEIRKIDGTNNNEAYPNLGSTNTDRIRIAPQELEVHDMVTTGPSGREISNAVHDQSTVTEQNPFGLSSWMWAFGQFIDHDCCADADLSEEDTAKFCTHESCTANIAVPVDDPLFSNLPVGQGPKNFMHFARTEYSLGKNSFDSKKFRKRDQRTWRERKYVNTITHWIDASNIYGSTEARLDKLRDLRPGIGRGCLASVNNQGQFPITETEGVPIGDGTDGNPNEVRRTQFLYGDVRGNENRILLTVQTLWFREHNRVANLMWKARGSPSDCGGKSVCANDIFEHARAYVIGLYQKIMFDDWLPLLLGETFFNKHVGRTQNFHKNPRKRADPRITSEFSVAAFRIGHTFVNENLLRVNDRLEEVGDPVSIQDTFFLDAASVLSDPDEIPELALGLGAQLAENPDGAVIDGLRNMLFFNGIQENALDLTALNAQRGRDNGNNRFVVISRYFCRYVQKKKVCPRFRSFEDINPDPKIAGMLRSLYKDVSEVEWFAGGLVEQPKDGSNFAHTFSLVIADQFKRFRDSDRFWYERYLPSDIVRYIKENETLGKVIARNYNVRVRQSNVFKVGS